MRLEREKRVAGGWALLFTSILAALIVYGSRRLDHFDAALVGYTFATLFATFGVTYRYAMWLNRPPTRMYWRRGWRIALKPGLIGAHALELGRRFVVEFAANRFIFRRSALRGATHWLIMWGCILAAAITFPLVYGWVFFETVPGDLSKYRAFAFGVPLFDFGHDSLVGHLIFHGLVWSALLVIPGVLIAFQRRVKDHGAAALQDFQEDILPLFLLFAVSVTGLLLTVSYTWMKGYAYEFLAILHAVTVIFTRSPSRDALSRTVPPGGVWRSALAARFCSACSSRRGSPTMRMSSCSPAGGDPASGRAITMLTPLSCAALA